ncbi:C40 family peptidase [uncultured Cocleimonas sp.]|uniref:C40 family peptidase n=1 Tax=uncultured Cocleimonas sp. TaxID=1051587 RepID=UPI0026332B6D|nr:C40 family peptidase [uncultured Cocleimonas sp.]
MKRLKAVSMSLIIVSLFCIQGTSFANSSKKKVDIDINQAYDLLIKGNTKAKTNRASKAKNNTPHKYKALQVAKKQINKRYKWGGDNPKKGFDCSGLIQYAYKMIKVNLPRSAAAQYKHAKRVALKHLEVGDLVFFHTRRTRAKVNHVGIYLGGNKFIHAPRRGKNVSVASFNSYWRKKFVGAGRV